MAQALASKVWEMRIRAAAVFMFLSGICVGASVSLLLAAVDLETRNVKQWPSLGVRTKLGKHATTYLLDVPELTLVVMAVVISRRYTICAPRGSFTIALQMRPHGSYQKHRLLKNSTTSRMA